MGLIRLKAPNVTQECTVAAIDKTRVPVWVTQPSSEAVQLPRAIQRQMSEQVTTKEAARAQNRTPSSRHRAQQEPTRQVKCKKRCVIAASIERRPTSAQLFAAETAAYIQYASIVTKSTWRREATMTRRRFSASTAGLATHSPIYA